MMDRWATFRDRRAGRMGLLSFHGCRPVDWQQSKHMQTYSEDIATIETVRRPSPPLSDLPPGPREPALIQTLRYLRDPVGFLRAARNRYGEPFTVRLIGLGTGAVITEPSSIRKLVTGSPETTHAGEANAPIAPYMGRFSLLILDGPRHMQHPRLLLQPLHASRLASSR